MLIPCPICNHELQENVEVDIIYCITCCRDWPKEMFIKAYGDPYTKKTTGHQIAHKIRIDTHLRELKEAVADAREKFGRDFIRALPQGKLLDALDAGREASHLTDCTRD